MTATNELVILETEQGIRRVEELGMENDFHSVVDAVEEIAATDPGKDRALIKVAQ